MLSLPRDKVSQVRLRYEAFFGQLGSLLDGDWSFEDTDVAYFLLDSVALGEDTAGAASLLFADFAHYFTQRKERERLCVLFADPDRIRELATGTAWLIRRGRAAKLAVRRAPGVEPVSLPEAERIDAPLERVETQAPKEIAYLDEED